jgi:serine/threonine protein kinase, bacterial
MTVGTVAYAAPEQLMGEAIDGRADQYALAATAFHLLTGQQPFQHTNPAVVISQHLTASPPAIADRVPELSRLGPVISKALAKKPEDRYPTCMAFADVLEKCLAGTPHDHAADGATLPAPKTPRVTTKPPTQRRWLRWAVVAAAFVVLACAAVAIALHFVDRQSTTTAAPPPPTATIPVVLIGADCATLGAEGMTAAGQTAYCARLPDTGDIMWSIYSGKVPEPSDTPAPTDEVYPPGIEEQVRVCVQQTGQTRVKCREDVRQGNLSGPA